jgi:hypothetical protein
MAAVMGVKKTKNWNDFGEIEHFQTVFESNIETKGKEKKWKHKGKEGRDGSGKMVWKIVGEMEYEIKIRKIW